MVQICKKVINVRVHSLEGVRALLVFLLIFVNESLDALLLHVEEVHVDIEVEQCFLVFLVEFAFAINELFLCHCKGHSGSQTIVSVLIVVLALGNFLVRLSLCVVRVRYKFIVQRVFELLFSDALGSVFAENVLRV